MERERHSQTVSEREREREREGGGGIEPASELDNVWHQVCLSQTATMQRISLSVSPAFQILHVHPSS